MKTVDKVGPAPDATWVYVTVPEVDLLDAVHPGLWLNKDYYGPGTHLVSPEVAVTLTERLKTYDRSVIRLLRPQSDRDAVESVNRGTTQGRTPVGHSTVVAGSPD